MNFGTGPCSIGAWVNLTSPSAHSDAIIGKDSYVGGSSYTGYMLNVQDGPTWAIETRNVAGSGPRTPLTTSTATSGWHFVVGVREGSSPATLRVYVDGVSAGSTTEIGTTNVDNDTDVTIGALNSNHLGQWLTGSACGVFMDSVARAAPWIAAEYAFGLNGDYQSQGEWQSTTPPVIVTPASFDLAVPTTNGQTVGQLAATGGRSPYSWQFISATKRP